MVRKVAIVSPYPPPGRKHTYGSGVAPYTKNLVDAFQKLSSSIEIHVVADRKNSVSRTYYEGKNVIIHRVYDKNPLYIFQIFNELRKIRPDVVHIQHEYFLYGGIFSAVLFPGLPLLAKLVSKKVILTIHGVHPLTLHENKKFKKENGIYGPTLILKLGILFVTKLMSLFSDKIIVHEPFLKENLTREYKVNSNKIVIIPHGVEEVNPLPQEEAKRYLKLENTTILLYFGYITGYKGIDILIDIFEDLANILPNSVLIIAGGLHPRITNKRWYIDFIKKILKRIIELNIRLGKKRVVFTGYLPEEFVPIYFSAADIVVLPYRARIAASGPEALAIAFEKCYIIPQNVYLTYNIDKYKNFILKKILFTLQHQDKCKMVIRVLKENRRFINIAQITLKLYEE